MRNSETKPSCYPADHLWPHYITFEVVAEVVRLRRNAILRHRIVVPPAPVTGRLLVLDTAVNLAFGLGARETGGLIDERDLPAWDIWVALIESCLVCWIPPGLVATVQKDVIETCPTDSFGWADTYRAAAWQEVWSELRACGRRFTTA